MTGKENFLQSSVIELVKFLMEKRNISTGNNKNKAGKVLKLKLSGKMNFLGGSSFYLGGAMFQQGRYWGGVNLATPAKSKIYISKMNWNFKACV